MGWIKKEVNDGLEQIIQIDSDENYTYKIIVKEYKIGKYKVFWTITNHDESKKYIGHWSHYTSENTKKNRMRALHEANLLKSRLLNEGRYKTKKYRK